jgi:hypothetical protein
MDSGFSFEELKQAAVLVMVQNRLKPYSWGAIAAGLISMEQSYGALMGKVHCAVGSSDSYFFVEPASMLPGWRYAFAAFGLLFILEGLLIHIRPTTKCLYVLLLSMGAYGGSLIGYYISSGYGMSYAIIGVIPILLAYRTFQRFRVFSLMILDDPSVRAVEFIRSKVEDLNSRVIAESNDVIEIVFTRFRLRCLLLEDIAVLSSPNGKSVQLWNRGDIRVLRSQIVDKKGLVPMISASVPAKTSMSASDFDRYDAWKSGQLPPPSQIARRNLKHRTAITAEIMSVVFMALALAMSVGCQTMGFLTVAVVASISGLPASLWILTAMMKPWAWWCLTAFSTLIGLSALAGTLVWIFHPPSELIETHEITALALAAVALVFAVPLVFLLLDPPWGWQKTIRLSTASQSPILTVVR